MDQGERCRECGTPRYGNLSGATDGRARVSSPADAYVLVRRYLGRAKQEKLVAIYLDAQNRILGRPLIVTVGSLNTTRTAPRELYAPALLRHALGVVIAHNHPSGSFEPSRDDVEFTRVMVRAGELLAVSLYDHLVVTRKGYVSMKERGLI